MILKTFFLHLLYHMFRFIHECVYVCLLLCVCASVIVWVSGGGMSDVQVCVCVFVREA